MMIKNIKLTCEIFKKNPIVWIVPLLMIGLSLNTNFDLIQLLQMMINTRNPLSFCKLICSAILTILVMIMVFVIVLMIVEKIFLKLHEPFKLTIKRRCIALLILIMAMLLPLNIFVNILYGLFRCNNDLWLWFWNLFLVNLKNIIFYYMIFITANSAVNAEKSFGVRVKASVSKQVILELIAVVFLTSVIETPLYYFPKTEFLQSAPLWVRNLRILCSTLINTFFVVYTAVLYYTRKKDNDIKGAW